MAQSPLCRLRWMGERKGGRGAKGLGRAVKSSVNCSPSSCIKFKGGCKNYPLINCKQKEGRGWEVGEALVWHTWSAHWAKWCHPSRWTQQFTIYFLINQTWGCFFLHKWHVCVRLCLYRVRETTAVPCYWKKSLKWHQNLHQTLPRRPPVKCILFKYYT